MSPDRTRGIARREFVKSAVAIGGTAALAACMERELEERDGSGETEAGGARFPSGTDDLPAGQHEWNEYLVQGAHGNTSLPQHQVILGLEYVGSVPPTDEERAQVREALATLEGAVQWGTGGNPSTAINDGLLTMLGYSTRYFDRLDADVEQITSPESLLESVDEDPDHADEFDAALFLTSDFGSLTIAAEEALWGELETFNGVTFESTLEGVFERTTRRTGVVGQGLVADEVDHDAVPEESPLSMGFRSGFRDSQPSEAAVTIESGPFAGGTTAAISRLHIDLDRWYDNGDLEDRTEKMFCPAHDPEEIGETADKLGSESSITEEDVERLDEDATERDRVGHSQKLASIRDDGFDPLILRRTEGVATDAAEPVDFNFTSIQRDIEAFVTTRQAMDPSEYEFDVDDEDHGIVDYLETKGRTALVVPAREDRALPNP